MEPRRGRQKRKGRPVRLPQCLTPVPSRERRCSATTTVLIHNKYDAWVNPFSGVVEDMGQCPPLRPRTVSPQRVVMGQLMKDTMDEQLEALFPQIRRRTIKGASPVKQPRRRSYKDLKHDYLQDLQEALPAEEHTHLNDANDVGSHIFEGKDGVPLSPEVDRFVKKFYTPTQAMTGSAVCNTAEDLSKMYHNVLYLKRKYGDSLPACGTNGFQFAFTIDLSVHTPSKMDVGYILIAYEELRQPRGIPLDALKARNWVFCGHTIDPPAFKVIDKGRCGYLKLNEVVKYFYPTVGMKEIKGMVKAQYGEFKKPSLNVVDGPQWLGRYTASTIHDMFELFKSTGADTDATGMLHVESFISSYINKDCCSSRLVDSDVREVFQSDYIDFEKFADVVEPAFDDADTSSDES